MLGWLYTFHISHFASILQMILQNHEIQNTRHILIVFRILQVFCECFCETHHKRQQSLYTSYFMQISCFINAAKK